MKNRIVTLFSLGKGVDKSNILYNQYIKELNKFIIFIKNFYKKTHLKWSFEKKQIIFVSLMTILTIGFKFKLHAKPKNPDLNLRSDSDSINVYDLNEDDGYIRDVVEKHADLVVPKNVPKNHLLTMFKEAKKYDIPYAIFFRWIYIESTWNKKAKSKDGAVGYTQLMPTTYNTYSKKLKIEKNATNNIKIGAFYLKEMYNYWANKTQNEARRWSLALASYNGNIIRVKKLNAVPSASASYVKFIMKNYE